MASRALSTQKIIIKTIKDTHMHAAIRNAESDKEFLLNLLLRSQKVCFVFCPCECVRGGVTHVCMAS